MDRMIKVSVWVQLHSLDLIYWCNEALSKIASKLRNPLRADHVTTTKAKISYARVLVEVDVSNPLVEHIVIRTPYVLISQDVYYEWVPPYCLICSSLGHKDGSCKKVAPNFKKIYVPKHQTDKKVEIQLNLDKEILKDNGKDNIESSSVAQIPEVVSSPAHESAPSTSKATQAIEWKLVKIGNRTTKVTTTIPSITKDEPISPANALVVPDPKQGNPRVSVVYSSGHSQGKLNCEKVDHSSVFTSYNEVGLTQAETKFLDFLETKKMILQKASDVQLSNAFEVFEDALNEEVMMKGEGPLKWTNELPSMECKRT